MGGGEYGRIVAVNKANLVQAEGNFLVNAFFYCSTCSSSATVTKSFQMARHGAIRNLSYHPVSSLLTRQLRFCITQLFYVSLASLFVSFVGSIAAWGSRDKGWPLGSCSCSVTSNSINEDSMTVYLYSTEGQREKSGGELENLNGTILMYCLFDLN